MNTLLTTIVPAVAINLLRAKTTNMSNDKNNKNSKQDTDIGRLQTDIGWIKKEITEIKNNHLNSFNDIKHNHLSSIYSRLGSIEKKLLQRPSWFVSIILTALVGLVATLITLFLK